MDVKWTDVVTAIGALAAVGVGGAAWMAALSTLRTSYRPVVRVAPTFRDRTSINPNLIVLENVGFGPALSAMLFEARDLSGEPLGYSPVIEVLGTGEKESNPSGRVEMSVPNSLRHLRDYQLIYQDITGNWHETRFTARQQKLVVRLMGPLRAWHTLTDRSRAIPKTVRERGNVARAAEAI